MADKQGECRLCDQDRPLCRSHIVPEFAYAPLKNNDKQQIYALDQRTRRVQTGYFERLLCSDCEQLLSRYESRFKQDWMDTIPTDFNHLGTSPSRDIIRVEVADPTSFKLFHLSVFWRASVSKGFKFGPAVSFDDFEPKIRQMLLNGDPGQPGDLPFVGYLKLDRHKRPEPSVVALAEGEGLLDSHRYFMMSYAYCDWMFVLGAPGPQWLVELEQCCREEKMCLISPKPHADSKSFNFSVEWLRQVRQTSS